MKLCKDCKYAGQPDAPPSEWIPRPPSGAISLVYSPLTGEHLADPLKCNTNRQIGPCGMDAQHWEAGDPPAVGFV